MRSALARLEAGVLLVDDIDAALPPNNAAVLVPALERAQRIANFHPGLRLFCSRQICQKAPETMRAPAHCQFALAGLRDQDGNGLSGHARDCRPGALLIC